jgi:hypothetical protein
MLWFARAFLPPSESRSERETAHLPACAEMYVQCAGIYSTAALSRTQVIRIGLALRVNIFLL